jgi:hypothetical protein
MSKLGKLFAYGSLVRAQTGKSMLRQALEIFELSRGRFKLGVEEYYELGVFDDTIFSEQVKTRCVGWRGSATIDRVLNDDYWRAAANDKVLNYALLVHYGFPVPETLATYSPSGRKIANECLLRTEDELRRYLSADLFFPVFVKPIHGTYGRGTFCLQSALNNSDACLDIRGRTVSRHELLAACLNKHYGGMLFQKRLVQHPEVAALVGPTVSCVRVIIALGIDTSPEVVLAFWKIGRKKNITDNFCMGESGNLLAWVDVSTGTVQRVITGLWPTGTECRDHPDTNATLVGARLPDWAQALALCCKAAELFTGLRLQHWDIAFSDQGPILMELNTEADLGVPQYLGRSAFVTERIDALMSSRSHG